MSGAAAISANGRHDLALLANGTVMSWGDNTFGQFGNGTTSANRNAELPVAVTGLPKAVAVAGAGPGAVWAAGTQEIPGQCCLRTLPLHTSAG